MPKGKELGQYAILYKRMQRQKNHRYFIDSNIDKEIIKYCEHKNTVHIDVDRMNDGRAVLLPGPNVLSDRPFLPLESLRVAFTLAFFTTTEKSFDKNFIQKVKESFGTFTYTWVPYMLHKPLIEMCLQLCVNDLEESQRRDQIVKQLELTFSNRNILKNTDDDIDNIDKADRVYLAVDKSRLTRTKDDILERFRDYYRLMIGYGKQTESCLAALNFSDIYPHLKLDNVFEFKEMQTSDDVYNLVDQHEVDQIATSYDPHVKLHFYYDTNEDPRNIFDPSQGNIILQITPGHLRLVTNSMLPQNDSMASLIDVDEPFLNQEVIWSLLMPHNHQIPMSLLDFLIIDAGWPDFEIGRAVLLFKFVKIHWQKLWEMVTSEDALTEANAEGMSNSEINSYVNQQLTKEKPIIYNFIESVMKNDLHTESGFVPEYAAMLSCKDVHNLPEYIRKEPGFTLPTYSKGLTQPTPKGDWFYHEAYDPHSNVFRQDMVYRLVEKFLKNVMFNKWEVL